MKGRAEADSETVRETAWTWLISDLRTRFGGRRAKWKILAKPELHFGEPGTPDFARLAPDVAGWLRAKWIARETGRRARIYELTSPGAEQLAAEESRWAAVASAVNCVLRMA